MQDHLLELEGELSGFLEPEEAFLVASHRLGAPRLLTEEFGKVTPNRGWLLRLQWAIAGLVMYWHLMPAVNAVLFAILVVVASFPNGTVVAAAGNLYAPYFSVVLVITVAIAVIRRQGASPEAFEYMLQLDGWPVRTVVPLMAVASAVWLFGFGYAASRAQGHLRLLIVIPQEVAPLQSPLWSQAAVALNYVLPIILLVAMHSIQRRRSKVQL